TPLPLRGRRAKRGGSHPVPQEWAMSGAAAQRPLLDVNGIEVIYNHVILVLKGVSLQVPEGRVVSNLLAGERGAVTKGSIELRGERIERLSTSDMVERGVVQVMEGRRCFG